LKKSAKYFLSALFCLIAFYGYGISISGKVTDDSGKPVPFASVYLNGTSIGTTANADGEYSLDVKTGEYDLVFRSIGFKLLSKKVSVINAPLKIDAILQPESYQLKEATVKADAEDPAYEIIRKAQKKRKSYLNQVESFSCSAYIKSVQRITEYPKKLFGEKVDLSEILDTTTGIIYLSESVSKLNFKKPDHVREEMISSKVSGNNRSFSFNQGSDVLFNFYENLIDISGLVKRGIVSPISASAMMYYDYTLEGTFVENGETVNKIKVIPKRKHDPVFTGDIYIIDDSWRIHSLDLLITKDQQMEFIDTFRIKEVYVPVEKNVWMLFNSQFSFVFGGFGFHGRGMIDGILTNYNLHPDFAPNFFNGEVMKIDRQANKKDSLYWNDTRPVPLTLEEGHDYVKRDSSFKVHESKPYRDSVDREHNKVKASDLILTGYMHQNSIKHERYFISGLLSNFQFNTVEGFNISVAARYSKRIEDEEEDFAGRLTVGGEARYGFSNGHFNGNVFLTHRYDLQHLSSYTISAGTAVSQFNSSNPISELVNSAYTLFARYNYMKIYEKQFASVAHRTEITNGLVLNTSLEYAKRLPLANATDYSFASKSKRDYTSNDPLNPQTDSLHFPESNALKFDVRLRVRFKQEYMTLPQGKRIIGSKYPELSLAYTKGIHNTLNSDVDYDLARASLSHEMRFGLLGGFKWNLTYGKFLTDSKMQLMDWHHFNGNKTFISSFQLNDFSLLDYYTYSTDDEYTEAHGEYNFGGLILNKIPLIRKLKLSEIAGIHYFRTPFMKDYFETSFGLEKLGFLRADFAIGFANGKKASTGFLIGIKANLSGGSITIE
jgi:hypothetical protein